MCQRTKLLGVALLALGAGFILSCIFSGWIIRLLIGAALVVIGLLISNQR